MKIFIDPTETREGSKLPDEIERNSTSLFDLEEKTGADFLVSPLTIPASSDYLLQKHCNAGILVQRKTGSDFVSSTLDKRILTSTMKMRQWCDMCFIVIHNYAVWSNIADMALMGSLAWAQIRGVIVVPLAEDTDMLHWCEWALTLRDKIEDEPYKAVLNPRQKLIIPNNQSMHDIFGGIRGFGVEKVNALYGVAKTPAKGIEWLSSPQWLDKDNQTRPGKIFVSDVRKFRSAMGLNDEHLQMLVAYVPDGTQPKVEYFQINQEKEQNDE